jgi:hypothetical protein
MYYSMIYLYYLLHSSYMFRHYYLAKVSVRYNVGKRVTQLLKWLKIIQTVLRFHQHYITFMYVILTKTCNILRY